MACLSNVGSFLMRLISSHRSFSWKLLTGSHCHRSLCHPISSQLISSHVLSAGHSCSLLFSVTWTFLISSHLISAFLKFHSSSQLFSTLRSSCQLILCLLVSSLLFSHLLSSSHISSADLSSCQLVSHISALLSTLSNHLSSSLAQNLLQTRISVPKQATPTPTLPQRRFDTENLYTQQAFAQRSLYTQKPLHRDREAFTHNKLLHRASFCTQQTFTQRSFCTQKLLHREAFTRRHFCTQKLVHTEAFTHRSFYIKKPVHREAFTHSKLSHKEAPTQKVCTQRSLYYMDFINRPHSFSPDSVYDASSSGKFAGAKQTKPPQSLCCGRTSCYHSSATFGFLGSGVWPGPLDYDSNSFIWPLLRSVRYK